MALYDFTQLNSNGDITVDNFKRYVADNRKQYHNLYTFMDNKNILN